MFRWTNVDDQTIFGMTVKMYRDPFVESDYFVSPEMRQELDHYAYKYLQSELYMYRILDINFDTYIEERGNLDFIEAIKVPTARDTTRSIL